MMCGVDLGADDRSQIQEDWIMRKSLSIVAIAAFGLAMPILAGEFDGADARARISLNQCISSYKGCIDRCVAAALDYPFPPPHVPGWGYCESRCDSNHSACVDLAMSSNGPASPPKRKPPVIPGGNILETSPGFSPQSPSGMGAPVSAPPPRPVLR
jgi:hypothetical protein